VLCKNQCMLAGIPVKCRTGTPDDNGQLVYFFLTGTIVVYCLRSSCYLRTVCLPRRIVRQDMTVGFVLILAILESVKLFAE
jgi:hypothetical protein